MANSKFPLNGRYATLGDLVHEYALASPWPTNLTGEDEDTYGWDINSQQPYISLVYTYLGNDEYDAKSPYELVWFGNVYSDTIYDPASKMHKLILADDSSIYGFDRYIIASKISDNAKITESGIPFRFIIPDKVTRQLAEGDDQPRYCYNYKQDNGEATVLYTLQCIIDILDNLDLSSPDPSAFIEHKSVKRFLFGQDDDPTVTSNPSIIATKDGGTTEVTRMRFYYLMLFTNPGPVNVYPIFLKNIYDEILETNKTDNRLFVKPDSYTFLGSYYYTEKNIWYYNYTTTNTGDVPSVWELSVNPIDSQDPKEKYWLKSLIYYVTERAIGNSPSNSYISPVNQQYKLDELFTDEKIIKSYLRSTVEIKLLYYTYWFLLSLRYHTSYITSCLFVKISSMTYLPTLPVLRCDLNIQRIIEKFVITSANHVRTTMLPAGPLTEDTTITINISYIAKFKNIANETESSFELTVSFRQLRQLADAGESDFIWYRLYYPTQTPQTHINERTMGGCLYGGLDPEDGSWRPFPLLLQDDWSLRNTIWPSTQVTGITTKINKSDFQEARDSANFNNGNCYSDTFDLDTYKLSVTDSDIKQHFKDRLYPPGGMLRIHNSYVKFPEDQAINSSYYFDVSILRKRNYYYEQNFVDNEEATNNILVNLYYEPLYRSTNGTTEAYNTPNSAMPLLVVGAKETDHLPSSVYELNLLFSEIASSDNGYYTINILSSAQEAYMSVKALAGTMRYFISGDSSFIPTEGSELTYISDTMPYTVERFSEVGSGVWEPANEIISTIGSVTYNGSADSPVENQYKIIFTNNTNLTNRLGYNYFRLKFDNINNYIYFRINDYYTRSGDTEFNLCSMRYLNVLNADVSTRITGLGNNNEVYLNRTHLCYLTYHESDIKTSNLTYTRTQIGQTSPIYYRKPPTDTLYLKHTSVRFNDAGGHDRYIYTANNTPIYLAYTTITNLDPNSPFYNYTGYAVEETPRTLFSKISIMTNALNMSNICSIYMSFEPINVLSVGFTLRDLPEISEMDIKYVHYKNGENDVSVPFTSTSTNNFLKQMVFSVLNGTQIYLTPECITFKLNGADSNLADPTLYETFNVSIEYLTTNGQWSSGSFKSGQFSPQYSGDSAKDINDVLPTWIMPLSRHIRVRITFNRKT